MEKIDITNYMLEFQKLKVSIKKHDLILVVGDQGTGKTIFVMNCLKEIENITIISLDKNSNEKSIYKQLRLLDMFSNKKVFVYDDKTVNIKFMFTIGRLFNKYDDIKKNNKFIIIVNEIRANFNVNFKKHYVYYPKREQVLKYLQDLKVDGKMMKLILSFDKYNMRRIQYTLEDGYFSGYNENNDKFDLTKNNYLLSMSIAENLTNLRKLKEDITEADKYKFNNDYFYKDYLNIFYKNISKKRLRYPKELLELKKKKRW